VHYERLKCICVRLKLKCHLNKLGCKIKCILPSFWRQMNVLLLLSFLFHTYVLLQLCSGLFAFFNEHFLSVSFIATLVALYSRMNIKLNFLPTRPLRLRDFSRPAKGEGELGNWKGECVYVIRITYTPLCRDFA